MPPHSRITTFLEALRTRRTKTTDALETMFADPANVPLVLVEKLAEPGALNKAKATAWRMSPIGWARSELQRAGLNDEEVDHIRDWPDEEKEKVRDALDNAIQRGQVVRFNWELTTGNKSLSDVPDPLPTSGAINITFRSPEQRVRVRGTPGTDDVTIGVP